MKEITFLFQIDGGNRQYGKVITHVEDDHNGLTSIVYYLLLKCVNLCY